MEFFFYFSTVSSTTVLLLIRMSTVLAICSFGFLLNLAESSSELFRSPVNFRLSVCMYVHLSVNFHIFIFFSRTTGSISTTLRTKHSCAKKIRRVAPFIRGDNKEIAKIHWRNLKIVLSNFNQTLHKAALGEGVSS